MRAKKTKDKLTLAIQKITDNQTAIGKSTHHQVKHLDVVRTIENADYTAYAEMACIAKVKKKGKHYPFPARSQDIAVIKRNIAGYFSAATGKIYLNTQQSVQNLAKTIVHELIHKQNRARYVEDHYHSEDTDGPLFRDEWRARLAERLYEGQKPSYSVLKISAQQAIEDNQIDVEMPNPLVMPEGTYVLSKYQAQFEKEIALLPAEECSKHTRSPRIAAQSARRRACAFISEQLEKPQPPREIDYFPITPAFTQRQKRPRLLPLPYEASSCLKLR